MSVPQSITPIDIIGEFVCHSGVNFVGLAQTCDMGWSPRSRSGSVQWLFAGTRFESTIHRSAGELTQF